MRNNKGFIKLIKMFKSIFTHWFQMCFTSFVLAFKQFVCPHQFQQLMIQRIIYLKCYVLGRLKEKDTIKLPYCVFFKANNNLNISKQKCIWSVGKPLRLLLISFFSILTLWLWMPFIWPVLFIFFKIKTWKMCIFPKRG